MSFGAARWQTATVVNHRAKAAASRCQCLNNNMRVKAPPRTINIFCDNAVIYGCATFADRITADLVSI